MFHLHRISQLKLPISQQLVHVLDDVLDLVSRRANQFRFQRLRFLIYRSFSRSRFHQLHLDRAFVYFRVRQSRLRSRQVVRQRVHQPAAFATKSQTTRTASSRDFVVITGTMMMKKMSSSSATTSKLWYFRQRLRVRVVDRSINPVKTKQGDQERD